MTNQQNDTSTLALSSEEFIEPARGDAMSGSDGVRARLLIAHAEEREGGLVPVLQSPGALLAWRSAWLAPESGLSVQARCYLHTVYASLADGPLGFPCLAAQMPTAETAGSMGCSESSVRRARAVARKAGWVNLAAGFTAPAHPRARV
jgi:hypothetical protein